MSDEAAWKEMWDRQAAGAEMFATAKLRRDVRFTKWNGHDKEDTIYHRKAGERVLITMVSRFGHACIRGEDIESEVHGYDACVPPEDLEDVKFLATRKEGWREKMRKS